MQFSFEVDPDLDLAVGVEADLQEQAEDEVEDFEVGPLDPTGAKPGSEDKVRMLTARYAAGVPLWHNSDCYDHGPAGVNADGEEDEFGAFDDDDL